MTGRSWGRWGDDDERGALNLIDAAACRRGVAAVHRGISVSLGLPIGPGASPQSTWRPQPQHLMMRDGGDYAAGAEEDAGLGFADDLLIVACHGTTHLDALSHVWRDGLMWNGVSSSEVRSDGAKHSGVETVGAIATRGLLVDLPQDGNEPVTADLVEAALESSGITPAAGDALLVRTGWLARWRAGTASQTHWPGVDISISKLVDRWGLALVGADNISVEVRPSGDPDCVLPVHLALLRDRGVFLLELLDLEQLAAAGVTEFFLVVSPLRILGGSGSPVAPTAVF